MTDSHWEFKLTSFDPSPEKLKSEFGDTAGFVYAIYNRADEKIYIGSKMLWENVKWKVNTKVKGEDGKYTKKTRRGIRETDWRVYTGSSNSLNADIEKLGKENFGFYIQSFHETKSRLKYAEQKMIFETDAVLKPDYYNAFVGCRLSAKALGVEK